MKENRLPQIRMHQGYPTLFVQEEPFVILGGELHNSAVSSDVYMAEVWQNLRGLGLNSVVVPVYWECLEPSEGEFDFSQVQDLITDARQEGVKLVLLWFGLWKNAESMYVPGWMKENKEKYFVCRKANGEGILSVSPLSDAAIEKDQRAFEQLMKFIRSIDEEAQTVIMIQVENEIGLLGSERDYSTVAEERFAAPVPVDIAAEYKQSGTWRDVFGENAGEFFMAYYYARAVEKIAAAGKRIYDLPMYVNSWLEQFPWRAGTYPSGGPIMKCARIWKLAAPSIFTLAPDIYVPYVPKVMDEYAAMNNPLFIPEVRKDAVAATYALYAVFGCHGIGFSPFGIEELQMDPDKIDKIPAAVMAALNIDPSAFDIEGSADYLRAAYAVIKQLLPLYYKKRSSGAVQAFIRKEDTQVGERICFGEYELLFRYMRRERFKPESGGVVIEDQPGVFYITGMQCEIDIVSRVGANKKVEYVRVEKGYFSGGVWQCEQILNGDEKMRLVLKDMPVIYRVETALYY